jgi:predicted deacylase
MVSGRDPQPRPRAETRSHFKSLDHGFSKYLREIDLARLSDVVTWKRYPIPAGPAERQIDLVAGEVGEGSPEALVTAGIHGDEGPWGAWAIHKMLEDATLNELQGTLRIVPVANPFAMEADARCSPLDDLDLNRAFPGNPGGSHTERLADVLTRHALGDAESVIDLHGGGSWCVNSFAFQFPGGETMARAFQPPILVDATLRDSTLTGYARSRGAGVTAVEMGGRCGDEEEWAARIARGLRRALGVAGVMASAPYETGFPEPVKVGPTQVLGPSRGGIFSPVIGAESVGTVVAGGTVLGRLLDPVTMEAVEAFEAPYPKTAILLLRPRLAVVQEGAMTYVVASSEEA